MGGPRDPWNTAALDVAAYLQRIGTEPARRPDLAALTRLQRAHRSTTVFENLDIVLGRPIRLDLPALQEKLIHGHRGGYCYEHNLLFAALLDRCGFEVTRLLARIMTGGPNRPRTHMTLLTRIGGEPYLCDVGLGGGAPLEPIRLRDGERVEQDGWGYAIRRAGENSWTLRGRTGAEWADSYTVAIEPAEQIDYDVANHYTSTHQRSPFVGRALVQATRDGVRHLLDGRSYTQLTAGGQRRESVSDDQAFRALLGVRFGLDLSAGELDRLTELTTRRD